MDARRAPKSSLKVCANLIEFSAIRRGRPTRHGLGQPGRIRLDGLNEIQEVSATIPKFVNDEKQTRRYFVSGYVQGVGYRFFAQRTAEKLSIGGYARNLVDGRVEVLAIGSPAQLDEMKSALERGPRFSSVSGVEEEEAQPSLQFENGFTIVPDA